jgi:transposase
MRVRGDRLAKIARVEQRRSRAPAPPTAGGQTGRGGQDRWEPGLSRFVLRACAKGGAAPGPNPTDRGKSGTKRHLVVARQGIPLAVRQSAANLHDSQMLATRLDAVEPIKRPPGRPRKRPAKLPGDKGDDSPRCRRAVSRRGIRVRIARKGIESSERLGRHRWVVERTGSWLNNYRRLRIR